ncbi:hypothetical protein OAB59_00535 [Pelagibacteraceae bacterium]|nr:hypothetical protein [Pelagibacteraceae bacterium]
MKKNKIFRMPQLTSALEEFLNKINKCLNLLDKTSKLIKNLKI